MKQQFPDRLMQAVKAKNSRVCAGIDPRPELLPPDLSNTSDVVEATVRFCCGIIEAIAPYAACVKPQAAFFEALAPDGLAAMWRVIEYAKQHGLLVILDAKRGDISSTAQAYARACFGLHNQALPAAAPDAVTVNPYMGADTIKPFLDVADSVQGGLFVLVKTSNPGSGDLQDLKTDCGRVYEKVSGMVCGWADERTGDCGYSSVGAVVGATYPEQLAELRCRMPRSILLVPGYGAQGSGARDVAAAFDADGLGAVVNSSRGIMHAYRQTDQDWRQAAARAAETMREDLNSVLH